MKSSKQVALIVKEDGLIYVNEVPEEPICCQILCSANANNCKCYQNNIQYEAALASAKESAIKCADQEQATERLIKSSVCVSMEINKPLIAPGIYPIPDLQWEVKDVPIERDPSTFTYYEREAGRQLVTEFTKVAILL